MARVRLRQIERKLPRHAHALDRKVVDESQRWRILEAMVEEVSRLGTVPTNVAAVIAKAGVSRKTFYEQFSDLEECFLTLYDEMSQRVLDALVVKGGSHEELLVLFLSTLDRDRRIAKAFMVGVLGAGPKALLQREKVNAAFADTIYGSVADPLRRAAIIGGLNSAVVSELLRPQHKSLSELAAGLSAFVRAALSKEPP